MVFSNAQNVERVDQQKREDGIFSDNFGGLNTTASDVNCPLEDSPNMFNIEVDISGRLRKRKGTDLIRYQTRTSTAGYTLIPFSTGLEYTFLIEKVNRDIFINAANGNTITQVMSKTNVWNDRGGAIKATWVASSEVIPRIIMCTGVNQPVQLTFLEQQRVASGTAANFAFTNAELFADSANTSDLLVFKNRTMVTPSSVSYSTGTLTLNGVSVVANDVIDVISITWQHVVDALFFTGDRFYQVESRFNTTVTDQILEVPERLRDSNTTNYNSTQPDRYNYVVHETSTWNDVYTYSASKQPSSSVQWATSDGARYVSGGGNTLNPSPLFITFGEVDGGATPSGTVQEAHFIRVRDLDLLNGGTGVLGSNLKVYVDDVLSTQNTAVAAGAYKSYWLYNSAGNVTNTSTPAFNISFASGNPIGVPTNAEVKIIHTPITHIGSGATQDVANYKDGACYPMFGLGAFADYSAGAFPRNVAIFQGRLIFSGFLNQPLRVLVSELYDKTFPGQYYQNFTIDAFTVSADDAFDFTLSSTANDFVTGLVSWQNSLFILTRQAVFRLTGGDAFITNVNKNILYISQNGCINPYSVVQTDKSVMYVSDSGVYDLFQSIESEQYQAGEKSIKIRNLFGITKNPTYALLPWLSYDTVNQKMYLGYPVEGLTTTCYRLFVYNTYRQSWTEYRTTQGFNTFYGVEYIDRTEGKKYILATAMTFTNEVPQDISFIQTEGSCYLDYCFSATGNGATTAFDTQYQRKTRTYVLEEGVYNYDWNVKTAQSYEVAPTIPLTNVEDFFLRLETAPGSGVYTDLTLGVDWQKTPSGDIYLLNHPEDNRNMLAYVRLPGSRTDAGQSKGLPPFETIVFLDNVFQQYTTDFTLSVVSGKFRVNFVTAPANNAVIRIGSPYPVFWSSPLLTLGSFAGLKRTKFIYTYFDNEEGQELFTQADVNSSSSQEQSILVGQQKRDLNVSIGITYDSESDAETVTDIYGFSSLVWDDSLFDLPTSPRQFRRYSLFKESLLGVGYAYRLVLYSYDDTTFAMSAYQISPIPYADRFINFAQ